MATDLDPNEEDAGVLWAEIHRLRAAVQGPDGFETWQQAAVAERVRRVAAEKALAAVQAPAVKAEAPAGMVLVSVERLRKVFMLAKMAGDNIVAHSKAGKGMTGWLDDACTYADSAGVEVAAMCHAASKPPVQGSES